MSQITCVNLSKTYRAKTNPVNSLQEIDLEIAAGEFLSIQGASGSGKTTLLLAIGGMLQPTTGSITIEQQELYSLSSKQRASFRARNIGFVFQMFHLVPYLSVIDNVLLASHQPKTSESIERAEKELVELGLEHRLSHRPAELSAGERQRTAIARAMFNQPSIILADEPTGNLDPENSQQVFQQLQRFNQSGGTVIAVSHGTDADSFASRTIHLQNGRIAP